MEGPDPEGICWPKCVWFKCGKIIGNRPAIQYRGGVIWCTWINDNCIGPACSFAICARGKLMSDRKCGLIIRRVTTDVLSPEDLKLDIKVKGKIAKRLGPLDDVV